MIRREHRNELKMSELNKSVYIFVISVPKVFYEILFKYISLDR